MLLKLVDQRRDRCRPVLAARYQVGQHLPWLVLDELKLANARKLTLRTTGRR